MDHRTRAVYEKQASEWARLRPPQYRSAAQAFGARCLPGRVVVDVGCGPGSYFDELGRPLAGLDGAMAMLGLARRAGDDVFLVQGDLCRLPFARDSLGGAWARASYLHVHRTGLPAALAQLHGALALDAPVELSLKTGRGEGRMADDDFPGRFFAYWAADELAAVMAGAGFVIDTLQDNGDWLVVRATRARTLPDFVAEGMRVLVCGLNPSLVAADAGFGFAGPTNRFWAAAEASGLVSIACRPLESLAIDRVGMTDLVKRATPRAADVARREYREGEARVHRLVEWLQPALVLFVGLEGWRVAIDRSAQPGRQPGSFGGVPAYVMPSTSGLNARTGMQELVDHMRAAQGYSVAGGE